MNDRFEIETVLGRGGFGIVYRTKDRRRGDHAVLKELVPESARRRESGLIELPEDGARLRERFLDEARTIARLNVPGVLPIRASFAENGTAYFATELLPDAVTLEQLLKAEGRMDPEGALDLFYQLLETLEAIHAKGVLHRDIKPSNILVTKAGNAYLIDFGAAREWHADARHTQTVMFTPGYAPPEQLSERAKRGPATDIYGLCATLYHMLAGEAPLPASDRVAGLVLKPLAQIRRDVDGSVLQAIEKGMELRYADRPQDAEDLRRLMHEFEEPTIVASLAAMDEKLVRLKSFTFEKRACPACKGLLVEAKPLRLRGCPVCREGIIRVRDLHENLCPVCQTGALRRLENQGPLAICPQCDRGRLVTRRKTLLSRHMLTTCASCEAVFELADDGMVDADGQYRSFEEWRVIHSRGEVVWVCDGCHAQLDEGEDGRLGQVHPKPKGPLRLLYRDEWARVAVGLDPGAGNAECDACGADYYVEGDSLTLLACHHDPHGWSSIYLGRRISLESVRWLAIGKESPNPGLVCDSCGTEFDREVPDLWLVHSPNRRLGPYIDQRKSLEDWHRIGAGLPEACAEDAFEEKVDEVLADAYAAGEVGIGGDADVLWRGTATRISEGWTSTLAITSAEITFGGLLRKWRVPLDAVVEAAGEGRELRLRLSGESEEEVFEIEPIELTAHLKSGSRAVVLDGARLAARIRNTLTL